MSIAANVKATFNERVQPALIGFVLRDDANTVVPTSRVRGPDGRSFIVAVRHAPGLPRDQSRARRGAALLPITPFTSSIPLAGGLD